ncbi:hypothetical protein ONZ45_g17444 [Pleurotus djamor]|nr:hypothetical protein ONZ45_g17444 [Pleurotus djamor]
MTCSFSTRPVVAQRTRPGAATHRQSLISKTFEFSGLSNGIDATLGVVIALFRMYRLRTCGTSYAGSPSPFEQHVHGLLDALPCYTHDGCLDSTHTWRASRMPLLPEPPVFDMSVVPASRMPSAQQRRATVSCSRQAAWTFGSISLLDGGCRFSHGFQEALAYTSVYTSTPSRRSLFEGFREALPSSMAGSTPPVSYAWLGGNMVTHRDPRIDLR